MIAGGMVYTLDLDLAASHGSTHAKCSRTGRLTFGTGDSVLNSILFKLRILKQTVQYALQSLQNV